MNAGRAIFVGSLAVWVVGAATPAMRLYSTADGLVRNSINRIFSDSRGFLWFATSEGISRFDGLTFRNYGVRDGLPDRDVTDVIETKDGLWFATAAGLSLFHPDASARGGSLFTNYGLIGGANLPHVNRCVVQKDGRSLWCATARGLFRFGPSQSGFSFSAVPLPPQVSEPDTGGLYLDRSGSVWVLLNGGLARVSPSGATQWFGSAEGVPPGRLPCLAADRNGRLWLGSEQGLYRIAANAVPGQRIAERVFSRENGLTSNLVNDLLLRRDGELVVATGRGLHVLTETKSGEAALSTYDDPGQLILPATIGEDSAGSLWLGTFRGALRIDARDSFLSFGSGDGLHLGDVKSIFEDRAGELCTAIGEETSTELYCRSGEHFARVTPAAAPQPGIFGWGQIHMQDRFGEWWIPSRGNLYRFTGVKRTAELPNARPTAIYRAGKELPRGDVFRLFEDSRGDVWMGLWHEDALVRWHRATGEFEWFHDIAGLPTAFAEDQSGNIWIGFYWRNLARFKDGRMLVLSPAKGFPDGSVFALHIDGAGRLWATTTRGGIVRIDNPDADDIHYRSYASNEGLASDEATAIAEDGRGRIYAATGRGIDRLDPASGEIRHFAVPAGEAAFRDREGRLWFGASRGLYMLRPNDDEETALPNALISSMRVRGRPSAISEFGESSVRGVRLGAADNQIQFDFFSINLDPGRKLLYQYRLDGARNDWSRPASTLTINYASVAPGRHRYEVRTVDSAGRTGAEPAVVEFEIFPPVWRRAWFLSLAGALALLLLAAAHHYRVRQLLEMARIRTRIATDLHDDIGASLSQIALLSEVARRENGRGDVLTRIGNLSRDLVDSMSDVVWAIDPRWDRSTDLVSRMRRFSGDLLSASNIEYRFVGETGGEEVALNSGIRRNTFLIFKETLHNIVKHAECTRVTITFSLEADHFSLVVEDDGRGFDSPASGRGGHGLRNMRARAAEMGGSLEILPAPRGGTRVELHVRVSRRRSAYL